MRPLHPSLQEIEAGLFGPVSDPIVAAERHEDNAATTAAGAQAETAPLPLPAYLRDAFARRAATLQWPAELAFARGQIRVVAAVREADAGKAEGGVRRALAQPVGALLRRQLSGNVWQSWLVSPDTDYATSWDVVLGEQDAPLDPLAGMVLSERACNVVLAGNARVLGVLSPERMQAIEAVAAQAQAQGERMPGESSPGVVVRRETPDGFVVATGTALAGPADPRRQHRALVRQLQTEIEEAAATVPNVQRRGGTGTSGWWQAWFSWRGAAAAFATLFVVQSAILMGVMQRDPQEVIYRDGVPIRPGKPVPAIRAIFSPDVPHARVMRAIRDISGIIVSGPNEHGEFVIIVRELAPTDAIARLRLADVIDSAEELRGGWGGR